MRRQLEVHAAVDDSAHELPLLTAYASVHSAASNLVTPLPTALPTPVTTPPPSAFLSELVKDTL